MNLMKWEAEEKGYTCNTQYDILNTNLAEVGTDCISREETGWMTHAKHASTATYDGTRNHASLAVGQMTAMNREVTGWMT